MDTHWPIWFHIRSYRTIKLEVQQQNVYVLFPDKISTKPSGNSTNFICPSFHSEPKLCWVFQWGSRNLCFCLIPVSPPRKKALNQSIKLANSIFVWKTWAECFIPVPVLLLTQAFWTTDSETRDLWQMASRTVTTRLSLIISYNM